MCVVCGTNKNRHSSLERVDSKMESREGERHGEYFQEDTYTPTCELVASNIDSMMAWRIWMSCSRPAAILLIRFIKSGRVETPPSM